MDEVLAGAKQAVESLGESNKKEAGVPALTNEQEANAATGTAPEAPVRGLGEMMKADVKNHLTKAGEGLATPSKSDGGAVSKSDGGADSTPGFYTDWFLKHSPYKPPTDEDLEKERRKQKRDKIFSSIGDGISALSNLYFTTKYAPNAYNGRNTLSERARERYDKILKDRQREYQEYMSGFLNALKLDQQAENQGILQQLKQQAEDRKQKELELKEKKADLDNQWKQLQIEIGAKKLEGQEAINRLNELKVRAMELQEPFIVDKIKAEIERINRSGRGGGSTATPRFPVFNSEGDVVRYVYTRDEAVSETERLGGTYTGQSRNQTQTQQDDFGMTTTTSTSSSTTPTAGRTPRQDNKPAKKKTNVKWK